MTRGTRQRWFWLAMLAVGMLALYLLREVLAPFVAGAAVAYLLDPICDRLQRLGVTKDASDHELKTAYRRLMNQHHPDKLVAKGLPQEMMDIASKKTMEIKEAYELILIHRE